MNILKNPKFRGWSIVISAFMIVFAFCTVDHAISPLVAVLEKVFFVSRERVLWLISYCTLGIVFGLFIGPQLLKTFKAKTLLAASCLLLIIPLILFTLTDSFLLSLGLRFLFGIGAGFASTILWWLSYESIDKSFYTAMITVQTAARPMAVAAGVPLVVYSASSLGWQAAFVILAGILVIFGLGLFITLPQDNKVKEGFSPKTVLSSYKKAFEIPYLKTFFGGMFICRICYFGIYSILGIWFMDNYNLTTAQLARPLMIIGICETLINFVVPFIMKIGQKKLFYMASAANIIVFAAFIWGKTDINTAILLIGAFAMTDRIYSMLTLMFIPKIFPSATDRTTIGSLITLVSWTSLALISYLEGSFLHIIGMPLLSAVLTSSLIIGLAVYAFVFSKTVFAVKAKI